jgi:hypothetical protein
MAHREVISIRVRADEETGFYPWESLLARDIRFAGIEIILKL